MKLLFFISLLILSFNIQSTAQKTAKETTKSSTMIAKEAVIDGITDEDKKRIEKNVQKEFYYAENTSLANVPNWVLIPKNATEVKSDFHSVGTKMDQGSVSFNTTIPADRVINDYKDHYTGKNFKITSNIITDTGAGKVGVLHAELEKIGKRIQLIMNENQGTGKATLIYEEHKK